MINPKFTSNWLKIINSNSKIQILEHPSEIKEIVQIPLTPVNIDAHLLYYFFEILYPKFINDQQNILDVIIYDDNKEILSIYLYETQKAGIHQSYLKLSNKLIELEEIDLLDIEKFFNKIQIAVVKTTGVRISTIRIFKRKAIDLINQYCDLTKNLSTYSVIPRLLGLIEVLVEKNLINFYPTPNFLNFIKNIIILLNGIRFSDIFEFLYDILPEYNTSFLFNTNKQSFILKLYKEQSSSKNSNSFITIFTPERLGIDIDKLNIPDKLNIIKNTVKTENVFSLNQNDIISLFLDIFELDFPLKLNNIQLIFQKILYGIRNFENKWYRSPRPLVYNSFLRFMIRLFRFNLNLKKISHWAIPQLVFNSIYSNFGLNSKILILVTSIVKQNFNKVEYIKNALSFALLFEIQNRELVSITPISKQELFLEHKINTLDVIRSTVSETYGFVSAVINIDKFLISEIIGNFSSNLAKFKLFSKFKIFKLFKKEYYFNIYPEIPEFKIIKEKGMNSFFKMIIPVLIDKHEF
ncbi:MAG: hypothetical protein ACFFHV_16450 [Promethearchaeota archaeon]